MSRSRRLAKLEDKRREAATRSAPMPVFVSSDMSALAPAGTLVHIHLSGAEVVPRPLPDEPKAAEAAETQRPQGQRPWPPTGADVEAARNVLRERARRGLYLGYIPPSEAELAADSARRRAEQQDAAMMRATARPAPDRPEAVNRLSKWVRGGR